MKAARIAKITLIVLLGVVTAAIALFVILFYGFGITAIRHV